MNRILAFSSVFIFVFALLPVQIYAVGAVYYITQNGNGERNGNSVGNALSASNFNVCMISFFISGHGFIITKYCPFEKITDLFKQNYIFFNTTLTQTKIRQ